MTNPQFKMLEKVFSAEMAARLPFQSKNKVMSELKEEQFIEPMSITLPGRFPVKIDGWRLTQRGHLLYCEECSRRNP